MTWPNIACQALPTQPAACTQAFAICRHALLHARSLTHVSHPLFCLQVRHYYYRLFKRLNSLIGAGTNPGQMLDPKNILQTHLCMIKLWEVVSRCSLHHCSPAEIHLRWAAPIDCSPLLPILIHALHTRSLSARACRAPP